MQRQPGIRETDRATRIASTHATVRRDEPVAMDIDYYVARARRLRRIAIHRALRASARGIARQLKRIGSAWKAYHRRRALQQELGRLDRRQLGDIGLTPGDVPAIVSGSFFRDPTRRTHAPAALNAAQWMDREAPGVSRTTV